MKNPMIDEEEEEAAAKIESLRPADKLYERLKLTILDYGRRYEKYT
jgi:hypothetical protein